MNVNGTERAGDGCIANDHHPRLAEKSATSSYQPTMTTRRTHAVKRGIRAAVSAFAGVAALAAPVHGQAPSFDPARLMADVETYYSLGVHRTAYDGDVRTSAWLAARFDSLGLDVARHPFRLRQFFLSEASIEDGHGRIPAFPIWLPRPTPPAGLTAPLVLVGPETPATRIRGTVAWPDPDVTNARARSALDDKAVAAGAAAIVLETRDRGGRGLFAAVNAERRYVDVQRPVPTLIFGSAESDRLRRSVGGDVTVRLTGHFEDAEAANVIGRYVVDARADWIVVSTPSSGWFTNAGERGPGIAMLLALAEWVSRRGAPLNYFFVATSGHELDYLGARLLHRAGLAPGPDRTRAWVHLGAQIATPPWTEVDGSYVPTDEVVTGTLQATEELAPILRSAFAGLPMFTLRTDTRIGEFRDLTEQGYRGLGIVGGSNPWFHVPGDDPRGVSAETLADVTSAMSAALLAVERWTPDRR